LRECGPSLVYRSSAPHHKIGIIPKPAEPDPAPLTPGQLWALGRAAGRQLTWGLAAASREIRKWRARAQAIPDAPIREDALYALEHKRTHLHGAALFSILPSRRNGELVRLLVAYELIWDFLDNVNERASLVGIANGLQLHLAVAEAINPGAPLSDYYRLDPCHHDGGYLQALVETCRTSCSALPSYPLVRPYAMREARRARVLALNHHPDPLVRDATLKRWAAREFPGEQEAFWWELSGAASAPLTIHALLALAAEQSCTEREIAQIQAAYCPWISAATTMLDSYVDQLEDLDDDAHSYVAHYPNFDAAVCNIRKLVFRSVTEARALDHGDKHAVIAAAMIAMYLSKDTTSAPQLRDGASTLVRGGGSLTKLLLPILCAWRIAFAQRAA
jgi:tetraprenyl-beta-curcumene synthase